MPPSEEGVAAGGFWLASAGVVGRTITPAVVPAAAAAVACTATAHQAWQDSMHCGCEHGTMPLVEVSTKWGVATDSGRGKKGGRGPVAVACAVTKCQRHEAAWIGRGMPCDAWR